MKEIRLSIPEGCKAVTVKVDGCKVTTEFEPKEEKWQPKDGDIIVYKFGISKNSIGIFREYCGESEEGFPLHKDYVALGGDTKYLFFNSGTYIHDYIRPATEAEKQLLLDVLAKEGYRWNAEKKEVERLPRWRALHGENYYVIGSTLTIDCQAEIGHSVDDRRYSVGNYFKTEEAAERVANQIREIFKNSKAE